MRPIFLKEIFRGIRLSHFVAILGQKTDRDVLKNFNEIMWVFLMKRGLNHGGSTATAKFSTTRTKPLADEPQNLLPPPKISREFIF